MSDICTVKKSTLDGIAEAIQVKTGDTEQMLPSEMARKIEDIGNKWIRPKDWPQYTDDMLENFEGVYWTVDNTTPVPRVPFTVSSSNGVIVEYGNIVNGEFVRQGEADTINKGNEILNTREFTPNDFEGDTFVCRVTPSENSHITQIGFHYNKGNVYQTSGESVGFYAPILETFASLPHAPLNRLVRLAVIPTVAVTLSSLNSATTFNSLVGGCKALRSFRLLNTDTSSIKEMNEIFDGCRSLTDIEMPNFSTESATNMQYMFRNCYSLQDIDLSGFDTGNVTNMQGMFDCCISLRHIDVSGFDTRKVTNMQRMFFSTALSELDLSSFGFGSVTNLSSFASNQLLVSIKFADETEHTAHGKSWTSSNDTNANTGQPLDWSLNLRNIVSFLHLGYSFSLRNCPQLTVDSIITVFEALQTVSETKTITIGNTYISKLTAEQIAIATDKGWTVA